MGRGPRARPLCLALIALNALAAEPGEPTALPPVVVPAPPELEPARPEAPSSRDPSGAITVLPVAEKRGQVRETAELIASAPGVLVEDLGGLGQGKSLSIRGASSSGLLVMLDGIPLNGAGG